jgi:hypothetical protein
MTFGRGLSREVHAPDHGIHSGRDFLVHMGTICLGLLIALGLEQAVIAIQDAHRRAELSVYKSTGNLFAGLSIGNTEFGVFRM